jgi:hypothetical protein
MTPAAVTRPAARAASLLSWTEVTIIAAIPAPKITRTPRRIQTGDTGGNVPERGAVDLPPLP